MLCQGHADIVFVYDDEKQNTQWIRMTRDELVACLETTEEDAKGVFVQSIERGEVSTRFVLGSAL